MIFKENSAYAIYNPITEKEWSQFFTYVDLKYLNANQKARLIGDIKKAAQQNVMARKLVRQHINQKNPTTITFTQDDINQMNRLDAAGMYSTESDSIAIDDLFSDQSTTSFFHELLHDQQNATGLMPDSLSKQDMFLAGKLIEAETFALDGDFYNQNLYYIFLKDKAIKQFRKNISKQDFEKMKIVNDGANINEAYNVFIDAEATKLAMGQSILMQMQPFGEEMIYLAEKQGVPIQQYKDAINVLHSVAQTQREWRNTYNAQSFGLSENQNTSYMVGNDAVSQKDILKKYFETEYPYLKGKNYFQTGLNSDEKYSYGFSSTPEPLEVGIKTDAETKIQTVVQKTSNGYHKKLVKNDKILYECSFNEDGFRNGNEKFYDPVNNVWESFVWKNGHQIDGEGNVVDLGLYAKAIDNKLAFNIKDTRYKVENLPEGFRIYGKKNLDYIFDTKTGNSITMRDMSQGNVEEIIQYIDEESEQFDKISKKLLKIPTTKKSKPKENESFSYFPSGHLKYYSDGKNNIAYHSDGLNYYVSNMYINGLNYFYYKPENGEKIGNLKSVIQSNSNIFLEADYRKDGTLLSSTIVDSQTKKGIETHYKSDGKTIHETGEIFLNNLEKIKIGKWKTYKGQTEIQFDYNQNRIDNVDVIGNPKKALSDILFADIISMDDKEIKNIQSQKTIVVKPAEVRKTDYTFKPQKKLPKKTEITQTKIEISDKVKGYDLSNSLFYPNYTSYHSDFDFDEDNLVCFDKQGDKPSVCAVDLKAMCGVKYDGKEADTFEVVKQLQADIREAIEQDEINAGISSVRHRVIKNLSDGVQLRLHRNGDRQAVCFVDAKTHTGKVFEFKKNINRNDGYFLSAEGYGVFEGQNYTKHGEWVEYDHSKIFDKKTYKTYNNGKEVSKKFEGMFGALNDASNQQEFVSETKKESVLANSSMPIQDNEDAQVLDMSQNNRTC